MDEQKKNQFIAERRVADKRLIRLEQQRSINHDYPDQRQAVRNKRVKIIASVDASFFVCLFVY